MHCEQKLVVASFGNGKGQLGENKLEFKDMRRLKNTKLRNKKNQHETNQQK